MPNGIAICKDVTTTHTRKDLLVLNDAAEQKGERKDCKHVLISPINYYKNQLGSKACWHLQEMSEKFSWKSINKDTESRKGRILTDSVFFGELS